LNYVMNNKHLTLKMCQCQNSKELIKFLDKTTKAIEFTKSNLVANISKKYKQSNNTTKDSRQELREGPPSNSKAKQRDSQMYELKVLPPPKFHERLPKIISPAKDLRRTRVNSPDFIIKRKIIRAQQSNKSMSHMTEDRRKAPSPAKAKPNKGGKNKQANLDALISLLLNESKINMNRIQKTLGKFKIQKSRSPCKDRPNSKFKLKKSQIVMKNSSGKNMPRQNSSKRQSNTTPSNFEEAMAEYKLADKNKEFFSEKKISKADSTSPLHQIDEDEVKAPSPEFGKEKKKTSKNKVLNFKHRRSSTVENKTLESIKLKNLERIQDSVRNLVSPQDKKRSRSRMNHETQPKSPKRPRKAKSSFDLKQQPEEKSKKKEAKNKTLLEPPVQIRKNSAVGGFKYSLTHSFIDMK